MYWVSSNQLEQLQDLSPVEKNIRNIANHLLDAEINGFLEMSYKFLQKDKQCISELKIYLPLMEQKEVNKETNCLLLVEYE